MRPMASAGTRVVLMANRSIPCGKPENAQRNDSSASGATDEDRVATSQTSTASRMGRSRPIDRQHPSQPCLPSCQRRRGRGDLRGRGGANSGEALPTVGGHSPSRHPTGPHQCTGSLPKHLRAPGLEVAGIVFTPSVTMVLRWASAAMRERSILDGGGAREY